MIIGQLVLPERRELVLDYIVERKRMDDLCSSIKDGRFKEQKVLYLWGFFPADTATPFFLLCLRHHPFLSLATIAPLPEWLSAHCSIFRKAMSSDLSRKHFIYFVSYPVSPTKLRLETSCVSGRRFWFNELHVNASADFRTSYHEYASMQCCLGILIYLFLWIVNTSWPSFPRALIESHSQPAMILFKEKRYFLLS